MLERCRGTRLDQKIVFAPQRPQHANEAYRRGFIIWVCLQCLLKGYDRFGVLSQGVE